ncbi:hypothetical protein [Candidatus Synchoanobacter obligatus]|uniref:aspartate kinase n=1 Tax=Candidatus Synchoanobacter obligatus TaxID=2919597 RepID=A0ABT1L395_9GAMM|nr:hypothetical protein [Candidatus Synchoanobacter obligatus]MCP8351699.1 hypothetical protein [Candidatus Synchoanobacter obligatus]
MHVRKYGGSSLQSLNNIRDICSNLPDVPMVIVLSAQGDMTNCLYQASDRFPDGLEKNELIALGEMFSCSLMQKMLKLSGRDSVIIGYEDLGIQSTSSHGGFIDRIDPSMIINNLSVNKVVIVPGFHAVGPNGQLAILHRGSSDDTAVALAIALKVPCHIYSNIPYIYNGEGMACRKISYDSLLSLITKDEAPMSRSAILMAQRHSLSLSFGHWNRYSSGTVIGMIEEIFENN